MELEQSKSPDLKMAVLIDADNVSSKHLKLMMEEIAKYGTLTIKRIYGDWTSPGISNWKSYLLEHAITPIQQYSYTKGKNSTDSAMIIDAMDILYSKNIDGFCIVSSDSDFTRLATRLRESGKQVIGIGEKKTPNPFIAACDRFIYLEVLEPLEELEDSRKRPSAKPKDISISKIDQAVKKLIASTINDLSDDDGWAFLGNVGSLLLKKKPEFDPRNYGFTKLTPMLKSMKNFLVIDERELGNKKIKHVYVKLKQPAS